MNVKAQLNIEPANYAASVQDVVLTTISNKTRKKQI